MGRSERRCPRRARSGSRPRSRLWRCGATLADAAPASAARRQPEGHLCRRQPPYDKFIATPPAISLDAACEAPWAFRRACRSGARRGPLHIAASGDTVVLRAVASRRRRPHRRLHRRPHRRPPRRPCRQSVGAAAVARVDVLDVHADQLGVGRDVRRVRGAAARRRRRRRRRRAREDGRRQLVLFHAVAFLVAEGASPASLRAAIVEQVRADLSCGTREFGKPADEYCADLRQPAVGGQVGSHPRREVRGGNFGDDVDGALTSTARAPATRAACT